MEGGRKLSGAMGFIQAMKGTEFASGSKFCFGRGGLVFLFPVKRSNLLLPVIRFLPFPSAPLSFPALPGTSSTVLVLPCYLMNPAQTFVTCLPVSFLRSRFPAGNGSHIVHGIQPSKSKKRTNNFPPKKKTPAVCHGIVPL
jgi:hypothetical protein